MIAGLRVEQKRETSLRRGVDKAPRCGVAMIVSSRPHEVLIHLDGAITELEPRAALEHLVGRRRRDADERVRLIVERATPLCAVTAN